MLPARLAAVADARPVERLPTGLTAAAGKYYVAAELSLRGWLATVTIRKAPATNVLARDPATDWVVAIQTKTASFGNRFRLGPKDEVRSLRRSRIRSISDEGPGRGAVERFPQVCPRLNGRGPVELAA